jgi:arabinogalactan oligomer / maltooligosaccharide transport system substrate-binding protein
VAFWPPQLVKVRAGQRGSGWAVGNSGVLTALHVVQPHLANPYHPETNPGGVRCLAVTGSSADDGPFDCAVVWQNEMADLALLQITEARRSVWWDRLIGEGLTDLAAPGTDPIRDMSAIGFPNATLDADANRPDPDQPTGTLLPGAGVPGRIGFDVDASTPDDHPLWRGLSGAAIRNDASGRLFAVVTQAVPDRAARRLYASPIPDPDTDPQWAAALKQVGAEPVLQDRYALEARRFLFSCDRAGRPWRVGHVPELADFGVRRARDDLTPPDQPYFPFVSRPEVERVAAAINAALTDGSARRIILLTGESAAGKSRLAAEVVTRMQALAEYRLIWPTWERPIGDLPEVFRRGPVLLWLDDLHRYLASGFNAQQAERLLTNRSLVVVATLQPQLLRTSNESGFQTGTANLLARDTLIARIDLDNSPKWSLDKEADLAHAAIAAADHANVGLGEYLAAYTELRDQYRNSGPWAKALIDCVADWSRTGMLTALPEDRVCGLWAAHYLPEKEARQWDLKTDDDRESAYTRARGEASQPVFGSSALISRTRYGLSPSDIALIERDAVAIPEGMWAAAAQMAGEDPVQADGVALQAALADKPQIAERLWGPLIDREPLAAFNLGVLRQEQDDLGGAAAAYQVAADSGHAESAPAAAFNLGILLFERGEDDAAKAAYQQAIDSGHPDWAPTAAFNLGMMLEERAEQERAEEERADHDAAKAAYQQAIDSLHPDWAPTAAYELGMMLHKRGEDVAAKAACQRAINSHHPDMAPAAAYDLGILREEEGEIDAARAAYQLAIDSGHPDVAPTAAVKLGNLLRRQGEDEAATAAYQQAINYHHIDMAPTAAVNLGILYHGRGEDEAATAAFQQAIDSCHPDVAPTAESLLGLLHERTEDNAAKPAYQQPIDPPHPDWAPTAAINLGILLPPRGESDAANAASQQAIDAHRPGGHVARVTPLIIWAERTRADTLARYFGRDSAFRRKYRISVRVNPFDRTEDLERAFTRLAIPELPPGHRVPPDIVVGPHDWIGQVTDQDLVYEPPPIVKERYRFDPKALRAVSRQGRLYAMPYIFDSVALIRNDALAGHGDMPTNIDELIETGRDALRVSGISGGLPLALQVGKPDKNGDAGDPYHLWPLFASANGSFFGLRIPAAEDEALPAGTFTARDEWRAGFIDAFAQIARLGIGPGGSGALRPDISRVQALAEFLAGRAPYFICSSRGLKSIKKEGMQVTVGVVPPLGMYAAKPLVSVYGFFIYRDAPNLAAARDLLSSYLSDPRSGLDLNKIQPLVPVQPGAMAQLAVRDALLRPYIDQCKTGMIMPSYPEMREAWLLLGQTEYKVLAGDGAPTDIASDAADRGWDLLAKARST